MANSEVVAVIREFCAAEGSVGLILPRGWFGRPHDGGMCLSRAVADEDSLVLEFDEDWVLTFGGELRVTATGDGLRIDRFTHVAWDWIGVGAPMSPHERFAGGAVELVSHWAGLRPKFRPDHARREAWLEIIRLHGGVDDTRSSSGSVVMSHADALAVVDDFFAVGVIAGLILPNGWFGRPHERFFRLEGAAADEDSLVLELGKQLVLTFRGELWVAKIEEGILIDGFASLAFDWVGFGDGISHHEEFASGAVEFVAP